MQTSLKTRRPPAAPYPALKGQAMEKYMCYGALGVAGLMAVVFGIDLVVGIPFGGSKGFLFADVLGLIASGLVGFLGFNAMQDLK